MAGGRKTYWEVSCPRCGIPAIDSGRNALNKVNPNSSKWKERCIICNRLLREK